MPTLVGVVVARATVVDAPVTVGVVFAVERSVLAAVSVRVSEVPVRMGAAMVVNVPAAAAEPPIAGGEAK